VWAFLEHLRDLGRASAKTFLDSHGDDVGQRSSLKVAP
jgi:NTE family protein